MRLVLVLVGVLALGGLPVRASDLPDAPPLMLGDYAGTWSPMGGWGDEAGDLTLEEGGLRFSNKGGIWKGRVFVRKDGSALFIPDDHFGYPGSCQYDLFRLVGPTPPFSRTLQVKRYSRLDMTTLTPSDWCSTYHYGQR